MNFRLAKKLLEKNQVHLQKPISQFVQDLKDGRAIESELHSSLQILMEELNKVMVVRAIAVFDFCPNEYF